MLLKGPVIEFYRAMNLTNANMLFLLLACKKHVYEIKSKLFLLLCISFSSVRLQIAYETRLHKFFKQIVASFSDKEDL